MADAPRNPDDREKCFRTRALAAFAVAQLAGVTPPEAATAVTDGSNDNGVDALHYDLATPVSAFALLLEGLLIAGLGFAPFLQYPSSL
jgi:hypothetical protein